MQRERVGCIWLPAYTGKRCGLVPLIKQKCFATREDGFREKGQNVHFGDPWFRVNKTPKRQRGARFIAVYCRSCRGSKPPRSRVLRTRQPGRKAQRAINCPPDPYRVGRASLLRGCAASKALGGRGRGGDALSIAAAPPAPRRAAVASPRTHPRWPKDPPGPRRRLGV